MPDPDKVREMFGGIAGRYDFANRFLSGGFDVLWRRRVARAVQVWKPKTVVDLACGSGDLTIALRHKLPDDCRITGLDFCGPMLDEARKKQAADTRLKAVDFIRGDCLELPFDDASVDVLTIAFGFRNFADREKGLREMQRVLRPQGAVFILEFTQPYHWFRPFYYIYLKHILPTLAKWVTGKPEAYRYLAGSIESFPECDALSEEITNSGFAKVSAQRLTLGVVALHEAVKR